MDDVRDSFEEYLYHLGFRTWILIGIHSVLATSQFPLEGLGMFRAYLEGRAKLKVHQIRSEGDRSVTLLLKLPMIYA